MITPGRKPAVGRSSESRCEDPGVQAGEETPLPPRIVGRRGRQWDVRRLSRKTGIHAAGWGRLVKRLEDKATGGVERIDPAFTSQTCHACGHTDHADVNAAKNIAAGRAVTARGALQPSGGAVNREPQPVLTSVWIGLESPAFRRGRTSSFTGGDRENLGSSRRDPLPGYLRAEQRPQR
ncbi:MAG: zinc ribbon domain-containing protein [Actinoallomurus sp.]